LSTEAFLFSKSICILISGRAGTGKTTTANFMKEYITSLGLSSTISPFAVGVKECAKFAGWDGNKDEKGRQFLIDIGMSGRKYDKDIWCRTTFKYIIPDLKGWPFDFVLVDDCRFPNEISYVKNDWTYQTFVTRIESPERECLKGKSQYNDESETSLPSAPNEIYDYCINNLYSLDILKERASVILRNIIDKAEKI
jgi:hypothetical protein